MKIGAGKSYRMSFVREHVMTRCRIVVRALFIVTLGALSHPGVHAQQADSTATERAGVGDRRPFTENADRYYIPVYPQYWIGPGITLQWPDLSAFEERYEPGEAPDAGEINPAFSIVARVHFNNWLSATTAYAFAGANSTRYRKLSLIVAGHIGFSRRGPSGVFAGLGLASISFSHDGSSGPQTGLRIDSRRTAYHAVIGVDLLYVGGPALSVCAGYEIQPAEQDLDLSTPFVSITVLF
jgi:hypothetical protein